jgi:hypothetical protein
MKQTAVEWFSEKTINQIELLKRGYVNQEEFLSGMLKLRDQAKEMEKEQTLKFGIKCQLDFIKSDGIRSVEDLYESTFNTNEK